MSKLTNRLVRPRVFLGAVVAIGCLAGLFWKTVVVLPTFTVGEGLIAMPTSQATLTSWFSAESWFSIIGIVVSLILGMWSWIWFRQFDWVVALVALGAAMVAAFCCWRVGLLLGPGPFAVRLANANVGDMVSIPLQVSGANFLLWAFAAITPVMLASVFAAQPGRTRTMTP